MKALEAFRSDPILNEPSQGGEADEDAAAAAIYAAECFMSGAVQPAGHAAGRLVDLAFGIADAEIESLGEWTGGVEDFIRSCSHPAVQVELQWQLELLGTV